MNLGQHQQQWNEWGAIIFYSLCGVDSRLHCSIVSHYRTPLHCYGHHHGVGGWHTTLHCWAILSSVDRFNLPSKKEARVPRHTFLYSFPGYHYGPLWARMRWWRMLPYSQWDLPGLCQVAACACSVGYFITSLGMVLTLVWHPTMILLC